MLYAERGLFYPWHHHPAEELYVIIAGHAKFEAAGKKTRQLGPGDTIFHASKSLEVTIDIIFTKTDAHRHPQG